MGLLWNRAKIVKGIADYQYLGKKRPVIAYLLLTNRCNLKCRYCFVEVNTIYKTDFTLDEWKQTVWNLKKRGCVSVALMGGEPMMYEGFAELVDYCHELDLNVDVTTNGYYVEKHLETVKKLNSVMLSMDGTRECMEVNRGKGSYDKALKALELMQKENVPVRINCVVTKQNYNDAEAFLDWVESKGLWVTFSLTAEFPHEAKELEKEIILTKEETIDYHARLLKLKRQGRKILFSEEALQYVIDYPLPYQEVIYKEPGEVLSPKQTCLFGQTFVYVNSNGDIFPCATLWNRPDKYTPKNIRRDGIDQALSQAGELACKSCFCPAIPEWKRTTSVKGMVNGLMFTLEQKMGGK